MVLTFSEDARLSGGRVLVHCMAGVSRSASLVIAYIMANSRLSVLDAYSLVNHLRSVAEPSFHFLGQIERFRVQLDKSDNTRPLQKSEHPQVEIMQKWKDVKDSDLPSERSLYESTKCMHTCKSIKCDA